MSTTAFRMRLNYLLAGLLLIVVLAACTEASMSQTGVNLMSPASSSNSPARTVSAGNDLASQTDPTQASPASLSNSSASSTSDRNGLTYQADPALASSDTVEIIPAVAAASDSPYWLAAPEYRQITLNGYPVSDHTFKPQIFIYPVEEFKSASPAAAQVIDRLQTLLQSPQETQDMPFLPLVNAKQVMHIDLKNLDFRNGKGVRYLTQFSQGIVPVNNRELIYTYQGLTDDGKYYVAAILPVTHASLPADEKISATELEKLASNYPQYLADLANSLNTQSADSFTPDLNNLDAMLSSLEIQ